MVSQGTVKGDGIFSPSLLSVYRYAYMTGFSVTIIGISLCPDSALSLSESVLRSYINFMTFPKSKTIKSQEVVTWTAVASPRLWRTCLVHFNMSGQGWLMPVWMFCRYCPLTARMFSGFVPRKFWNLFWNLLLPPCYLEEDTNPALSGIGIILPVCLDIPVYRFLIMFCCLFLCFGYGTDHEIMFCVRLRPEIPVPCLFYMLNQRICANFRQIFRIP